MSLKKGLKFTALFSKPDENSQLVCTINIRTEEVQNIESMIYIFCCSAASLRLVSAEDLIHIQILNICICLDDHIVHHLLDDDVMNNPSVSVLFLSKKKEKMEDKHVTGK